MYVVLLVCFGDLGVVLCCNGFVFFLFWVFLIAMNMHLYVGLYVFSRLVLSSVLYGKQKGWNLLESYMQFETCRSKSDMTMCGKCMLCLKHTFIGLFSVVSDLHKS